MKGMRTVLIACGGAAALLVLAAAQRPSVLATARPGQWEFSGLPGTPGPVRRCVSVLTTLAQLEHRAQSCTQVVIRDGQADATIHYTCTRGGFGQTEMSQITPRSYRIETQGISGNAPFHYVVQARRVGDC